MEFITYGKHLDKEKFVTPYNGVYKYINKPNGGLWASPVKSRFGWKNWCIYTEFPCDFRIWTKFTLAPDTKILIIDSFYDLLLAMRRYGSRSHPFFDQTLDWIKIMKDYQAVFLTEKGNRECHLTDSGPDLNAWDCESIVILDFNVINETGRSGKTKRNYSQETILP